MNFAAIQAAREKRAAIIAACGGLARAISNGEIPSTVDITVSEAIILGLIKQNVHAFFAVFGHGSTDMAEVLRVYQKHGLVKVVNTRSEIEASHAAAAMRWVTGQKSAVITSIGPGALQALAASLVPASDGLGVWYILGDETTEDEGLNMQQIPRHEQDLFLRLFSTMGQAYSLHTPGAIPTALRRGQSTVDHPFRAGPFFLLLPMNIQPVLINGFNLRELTEEHIAKPAAAEADYSGAADWLLSARKVVVRVGGGAKNAGREIAELLELVDGVAIVSPLASGVIPYSSHRNMTVGGSKGSLCGNYAMEHADLLLAIGSRFVCQSDCSRTAYPKVQRVININAETEAALHYSDTLPMVGDARLTLLRLLQELIRRGQKIKLGLQPGSRPAKASVRPGKNLSSSVISTPFFSTRNGNGKCLLSRLLSKPQAIGPMRKAWSSFLMPVMCRPTDSKSWKTKRPASPSRKPEPAIWGLLHQRCFPPRHPGINSSHWPSRETAHSP